MGTFRKRLTKNITINKKKGKENKRTRKGKEKEKKLNDRNYCNISACNNHDRRKMV
jgi:hypothetical protein